jgi:hypothetical protein
MALIWILLAILGIALIVAGIMRIVGGALVPGIILLLLGLLITPSGFFLGSALVGLAAL